MPNHIPPLILVADDQEATTIMLQRIFEFEGYQVHCVYDGVEALEAARELEPDLILLDIQMPRMNGFDVLAHLRETTTTASIPTILITAMGETSHIVQGLNLGADDYVRKPFQPRELLARAQSKMKARQLEEILHRRTRDLEALLRVSEALNQNLEITELLELILILTHDLLPGEVAIIYQLNEGGEITNARAMTPFGDYDLNQLNNELIVSQFLAQNQLVCWPYDEPLTPVFACGMATSIQYSDSGRTQGILMIVGSEPYDENHIQLLTGISRQANLALHNAELYKMQRNYALHLEDMVDERTKALQEAQQMLIRSEKLASIGRLSASIAHEINNPLMPIKINLEGMLEDVEANLSIDAHGIEKTLESVERIRRVVDRLLEFTGKSPTKTHRMQPLDINRLIENVHELVFKAFQQQGKTINIELSPLPAVYGDKDGLEQVFINLALNAAEAMDRGGVLEIRTYQQNDTVVIELQDTGSGIADDVIDQIFEPFITTKEDGNGLGLFVSYGIIQNHNGTIEVDSHINEGSTFTISLPLVDKAVSSPSA
jgi:signal transduction histidine kinase/DNA-binding response OmpR family regulator